MEKETREKKTELLLLFVTTAFNALRYILAILPGLKELEGFKRLKIEESEYDKNQRTRM